MKLLELKPLIIIFALTSATQVMPAFGKTSDQGSDIWSKAAIMTTYTLNRHLNPFDIDVEVDKGVATLRGTVESDVERDLAEQIALGVDGVQSVKNELTVSPDAPAHAGSDSFMHTVADANITAKIKSQLLWNKNTHGLKIGVDTKDAVVTLNGNVQSDVEAQLAEQIARNTGDVRAVENRIVVGARVENDTNANGAAQSIDKAEVEIADSWITTKVKSALLYNRNIDLGEIDVTTTNGIVHLAGAVDSEAEKQAAIGIVKDIRGVKDVKADLQVAAQARY